MTATSISSTAWRSYAERVAGLPGTPPWWTVVAISASSRRQAARYEWEIQRRREQGKLPAGVQYTVIPDPGDRRVGSGGATLHVLREIGAGHPGWWRDQRVLLIHSGGDSRRLPLYSITGKLFSAVPVRTPWGGTSTVFDEWMALSTLWVRQLPAGLLVGSGDVVLTFPSEDLNWTRAGVSGVAMRQPAEVGTQHGVYVNDDRGRVYAFLQKPSIEEVKAAGGLLPGNQVALDTGLVCFCPESATRLANVPVSDAPIDLYQHITMALTSQWRPEAGDPPALHSLAAALEGLPFWCDTVDGQFTHVGTTTLFRRLMTEETEFSRLYAVHQQLGAPNPAGVRSSGVVIDCILSAGGELGPGSLAMECRLDVPVRAARGSVLHGLEDIHSPIDVPEDTVLHQGAVVLPDHTPGTVIRVYGVADDPKLPADSGNATWFGRPMLGELRDLGIDPEMVWPDLPPEQWTLWNASLFPVSSVDDAWACARWMMLREPGAFPVERWLSLRRLSLGESAVWADTAAATVSHSLRLQATWKSIALALAEAGSDLRPMLAHAPGLTSLVDAGHGLRDAARRREDSAPTQAASRYFQASLFLGQAGLTEEADAAREAAFAMVDRAVAPSVGPATDALPTRWLHRQVSVSAPPRIDLGGGWSDTPPFCLDWGGSVLNVAVELDGEYPIESSIEVIGEPVIICRAEEECEVYRTAADLHRRSGPGDSFLIPRTALLMTGLFDSSEPLEAVLGRLGGGLKLTTRVNLPMGSGLGTSSILAASMLRAVDSMTNQPSDDQVLSDRVMRLEQRMTTGGGWQDQAGGIFPGAKLITSGPGLRQKLRVQPVAWSAERQAGFENRLVLYYTGIRRIARNLLQTVVGSYLARETATVEVLHSIKTLAAEMAYAMQDGDWPYLGSLLDRHWELNLQLDPNTTNAPVNALLAKVRPYVWGAKLAGAGGGGFLMLLAKGDAEAVELKAMLRTFDASGGALCRWRIAREGLRVSALS